MNPARQEIINHLHRREVTVAQLVKVLAALDAAFAKQQSKEGVAE